jgi:hypothetical protein
MRNTTPSSLDCLLALTKTAQTSFQILLVCGKMLGEDLGSCTVMLFLQHRFVLRLLSLSYVGPPNQRHEPKAAAELQMGMMMYNTVHCSCSYPA